MSQILRSARAPIRFVVPFSLVVAQVALACSQQIPAGKSSPIDLDLAKTYFAEAHRLAENDAGRLWGKSLAGPLLFVEPRTRFVVANQADAEKKLKPAAGVFVGTLPQSVPLASTAYRWAGTHWSMILWPLPEDKAERSVTLMHESWHRIQSDLGLAMTDPTNAHLDTLQGRYWLELEWRALARALGSTGEEHSRAIEDAVRFREFRRGLFPTARKAESNLEMNEGLAEYTGTKLSGLTDAEQRRYVIKHFETYPVMFSTYVRSFAYLTGPAYGLLLDQHAAGWLHKIKADDDLSVVLATALHLKPAPETEAAARQRGVRYDGAKLWVAETAREQARLKKVAAFRQLLVDGPVLVLPLTKFQMSFRPSELVPIEGVGTVYPILTLVGPWGKLEVHKASLITSDFKQAYVAALFKVEGTTLTGDGWELHLNAGWRAVNGERKGDRRLIRGND